MCVLYYMNVTLCISIWRHSFTLIQRNLKSMLSCLKCDLLNSIAVHGAEIHRENEGRLPKFYAKTWILLPKGYVQTDRSYSTDVI